MSAQLRAYTLLLLGIAAIVATVAHAVGGQRDEALRGQLVIETVDGGNAAMIDQETGVRGFLLTGDRAFLEPYDGGRAAWRSETAELERLLPEASGPIARLHAEWRAAASRWQREAARAVLSDRRERMRDAAVNATRSKALMDAFRDRNAALRDAVTARVARRLDAARVEAVVHVIAVAAVFGLLGLLLVHARVRRASLQRRADAEYVHALQRADSEGEAFRLLVDHIRRRVPGAEAVVLRHAPETRRLVAASPVTDGTVAAALAGSGPRCLSMRDSAPFVRGDEAPLARCEVCGKSPSRSVCVPTVVGGQVVGALLTLHGRRLRPRDVDGVEHAVGQAAPTLATLRSLASAEERASTDLLTGLANKCRAQGELERLVARAAAAGGALAVLLVDLDRFKRINDTLGHPAGDAALRDAGRLLRAAVRAGDVAARWGGEEFMVVLPDTDLPGAIAAAEGMRASFAALEIPEVPGGLTASIGVAALPDHAATADQLVRCADLALYAAKADGRDRVGVYAYQAPGRRPAAPAAGEAPAAA